MAALDASGLLREIEYNPNWNGTSVAASSSNPHGGTALDRQPCFADHGYEEEQQYFSADVSSRGEKGTIEV